MRLAAAAVALAALSLLACASPSAQSHAAAPATPSSFTNGQQTSMGSIRMEPYLFSRGEAADVAVRILLSSNVTVERSALLMFAFNLHSSTARVEFVRLETNRGTPVPLSRDEREPGGLQPRVFVEPQNLTGSRDLVMRGRAWATNNGQFHVGALVIAFDHEWRTLETPQGDRGELYAFALLGVTGLRAAGAAPPFEGQGNEGWAIGLILAAIVGSVGAIVPAWGRRQGRTPAPPTPAASPSPPGPAPSRIAPGLSVLRAESHPMRPAPRERPPPTGSTRTPARGPGPAPRASRGTVRPTAPSRPFRR